MRASSNAYPILCQFCVCPRRSAVSRIAASSFYRTSVIHLRSPSTPQGNRYLPPRPPPPRPRPAPAGPGAVDGADGERRFRSARAATARAHRGACTGPPLGWPGWTVRPAARAERPLRLPPLRAPVRRRRHTSLRLSVCGRSSAGREQRKARSAGLRRGRAAHNAASCIRLFVVLLSTPSSRELPLLGLEEVGLACALLGKKDAPPEQSRHRDPAPSSHR